MTIGRDIAIRLWLRIFLAEERCELPGEVTHSRNVSLNRHKG